MFGSAAFLVLIVGTALIHQSQGQRCNVTSLTSFSMKAESCRQQQYGKVFGFMHVKGISQCIPWDCQVTEVTNSWPNEVKCNEFCSSTAQSKPQLSIGLKPEPRSQVNAPHENCNLPPSLVEKETRSCSLMDRIFSFGIFKHYVHVQGTLQCVKWNCHTVERSRAFKSKNECVEQCLINVVTPVEPPVPEDFCPCSVHPCKIAKCPRFPDAPCKADCDTCTAAFYNYRGGKAICV